MAEKDRRLEALEHTILTRNGTSRKTSDGNVSVHTSHSPHAFYRSSWDFGLKSALRSIADEFPSGFSSLEQIDDDPSMYSSEIRWYLPVFSSWSWSSSLEATVSVIYKRQARTYSLEVFHNSSYSDSEKKGDRYIVEKLPSKDDVLRLLNAGLLWQSLDDKHQDTKRAEEKQRALAELP